jgi:hypothetical protein
MSMLDFWVVTPRGSSALKMEAACSSETLVSTYMSPRRYNPEQQHRQMTINFFTAFCDVQKITRGKDKKTSSMYLHHSVEGYRWRENILHLFAYVVKLDAD